MYVIPIYVVMLVVMTIFSPGPLIAQPNVVVVPDSKGFYESFFSLRDSTMRAEIGSFSFTGSLVGLAGMSDLKEFDVMSQTEYTITLVLDELMVHITRGPFISSGHRLSYYGPYGYVYKIDGSSFWGFDGSVPQRRLYSVNVYFDEHTLSLPKSAHRDIYEPNFCTRARLFRQAECHTRAFRSADGERIYIYMLNSRMPSLYEVCWIIIDGKYAGRIVDYAY